jgi:hypothetical protein
VLPVFVLTVLLPLIVIAMLWRRAGRPRGAWIATFILALGVVAFAFFVAPWGMFGLPVRYALVVLFAIATFVSLRREPAADARQESPVRAGLKVLLGLIVGSAAITAIQGRAMPSGAIDLALPVRGGAFLVAHGGSTSASNMYHVNEARMYSVVVVKLNRAGLQSSEPFDVVSPCDGVVKVAEERVVIQCRDADVWLENVQQVSLRAGAPVRAQQPIGFAALVTVHVERAGKAVPARFDGRWLVRNDLVRR